MTTRPRINITPTASDRALEHIAMLLLVLVWLTAVVSYMRSPEVVPIHFNVSGAADGYGNKMHILLLPLIPTAIYFLLSWLSRRPHIFNYPVNITEENAAKHYSNATRLIRVLKVSVLLVFLVIVVSAFYTGNGNNNGLGVWTIPILVLIMLAPTVWFIYRAFKDK